MGQNLQNILSYLHKKWHRTELNVRAGSIMCIFIAFDTNITLKHAHDALRLIHWSKDLEERQIQQLELLNFI